ncbi:MAG: hypothetical protein RQM92_06260 [Candidatus Syntrophopropionicum ammoniitolerans]
MDEKKAFECIGHLYPKIKDENGQERTVIAWIWARTVKCPNPACGCEMPLANSFVLSKKKGREAYIQPVIDGNKIRYEVKQGKNAPESPKKARGAKFRCIKCRETTSPEYIKEEAMEGRMGAALMAIVAEGSNRRLYISPNEEHIKIANLERPENYPTGDLSGDRRAIWCPLYGLNTFDKLFTNRQLTTLTTFSNLVAAAQAKAIADAKVAGISNDQAELSEGGTGAVAYGQAVGVFLVLSISKLSDYHSMICSWHTSRETIRNTFARQAIPMTWDYAEANPFCDSTGSLSSMVLWVFKVLKALPPPTHTVVNQFDAQSDNDLRNIMVSTDPPYYDNIGYADLSDFFYIWMRQSLKGSYPGLFRTMLVPKAEELVATPYRFGGGVDAAREFFEDGMFKTCRQIYRYAREDVPVTIYYAYKQSEVDDNSNTSSTGWETMLTALIQAGFTITGTWPMRTEMSNRAVASNTNALASSIVLVCRKRPADAPICTRRDFINALKRELKPALQKLQTSNIAPVDMAQCAIGPGMGVYSRFSKILEADGTPMGARRALQIINQELDLYFTEQDGEMDSDSRFCIDLYTQYAFNDVPFGEADVLARAKNTSVEKLATSNALYAQKGVVRLLTREEIPEKMAHGGKMIWLLTQQLTHALEKNGVAGVAQILTDVLAEPERAKALAYRLFTIAERKGWAGEAYAYNSLVIAWPEVQARVAKLQSEFDKGRQMALFDKEKIEGGILVLGNNHTQVSQGFRVLLRVLAALHSPGTRE